MRLSADPNSQHYRPERYRAARILLNGIEQRNVIEADEEARSVTRYKAGADGVPVANATRDGLVVETVRGKVRIELPDNYTL